MPDELDTITERQAFEDSLPKTKPTPKYEPNGRCYNCDAEIEPPKLYCDNDCADEHAWIIRRQQQGKL